MGNYNFEDDLGETQVKEKLFVQKMTDRYDTKLIGDFGRDYKWDFILKSPKDGSLRKFEMKSDSMAWKTGNFAMEYESRGKPSGVSRTLADYYVYEVERGNLSDYWLISTEEVKNMIESKFYHRKVVGGDPGSNTKMYLFRLELLEKYGKLLDIH